MRQNNSASISDRDISIDILRSIAIIGIFIAHSQPGTFFTQLRSFDVVLMVFLSAVCAKGFDRINFNYFDYVTKRFVRLILPVWVFLLAYYFGVYLLWYLPPIAEIASTFTFTSMWYVWIIRILFLLALFAPFMFRCSKKMSNVMIVGVLLIGMACSECIFFLYPDAYFEIVFMTIPYGMAYFLGLNIYKFTRLQQLVMSVGFLITFAVMSFFYSIDANMFIPTSEYKYPPKLYYMFYALGCTLGLWVFRKKIVMFLSSMRMDRFAKWIGQHTYWLYLLHIPIVEIVGEEYNPAIRFFIIFVGALICVSVKDYIVAKFIKKKSLTAIFNG